MNQGLHGHAHMFSDHIDTDQIYPGQYLDLTDHQQMAKHCLEGVSEFFTKHFQPGDMILAGVNFGCGSSRENAVIALKERGVSCVIAKSFARIFYRNAINLGLTLLVCPEATQVAKDGDKLELDLASGLITNLTNGKQAQCEPVGEHAMAILRAGGVKPYMRSLDKT